jgi:signal transduction histidine kinase
MAAANLPEISCDRGRLLQVLSNLIGNAAKVTQTGGSIDVQAEANASEVVLTVRDSGPGIAEQELPHIFERFWRGQKGSHKGTGLGLAISRGLVEAHGGKIWVKSRLGEGSTFSFSVPLPPA